MGCPTLTFDWTSSPLETLAADALLIAVKTPPGLDASNSVHDKNSKAPKWMTIDPASSLATLDAALKGLVQQAIEEERFTGAKGSTVIIRVAASDAASACKRIVLVGVGTPKQHHARELKKSLLKGASAALSPDWVSSLAVCLCVQDSCCAQLSENLLRAVVDGIYAATYQSMEAKADNASKLASVLLHQGQAPSAQQQADLKVLQASALAKAFAKDYVNHPSNLKSTQTMVDAANSLSAYCGVEVAVEVNPEWIAQHMPCFYTVALGSVQSDPPKWIRVTVKPEGEIKTHIALVGKTVVFDTGGYQVKPDNYMCTMKGDMTGGAVTLGAIKALGELGGKLALKQGVMVSAYLAATPNKIDSLAMLPDSIVNTTCGKKVEIRHTDAEGRLTLIDAVAMAAKESTEKGVTPDVIVTTATLTGSASRAVGECIAVMANQEAIEGGWAEKLLNAAKKAGDPAQALDVWESDFDDIKSKLDGADIINTSQNKNRGAQSAAAFVMSGAPAGQALIHLDIAGADMTGDEKATGIAQDTLIEFVLSALRA
ncbi:MAG: M17 family peptidase N-terminal domain-containing protein [Vampirovibrionales bacterium]|nr:M17 family peptidase N-terminal domain-containing protein [Vampirovibrionales bacterium]